ncbi:hypothetical protein P154DRAFT_523787 [Amniculicola lignicola CBS 123094]|uniref:Uncharacterized protein n=1 Tax=Amniculicola lignicola CBS 123094 TaxID=1392246 RepID=A0A6A5WC84_9PLEO|nr:hypothetical protein P154DRAFT_523787 [Amniculicola lignicola CBS 123094]
MSPAPITQDAAASASPPQQPPGKQESPPSGTNLTCGVEPNTQSFDDIFHARFMQIIQEYRDNPRTGALTNKDRKDFIERAYIHTDNVYFGERQLSDTEIKMRALTKVFYKVLAEEPWSDDWIRPHDVERKLSRFEMHKDSVDLAAKFNIRTPREAIIAARRHQELLAQRKPTDPPMDRGPFDDIEIIYIPGTVSSTATNRIDRETIYPVSVSSVAHTLQNHICKSMTRPYLMAEKFLNCTDTEELENFRQFACNVCDFAPHLLDNDNISLLIVLLILTRSDACKRFHENGIRIEGSTISHRRSECMKTKLGWKTADDRRPFDSVANEFQIRVRNACFPAPRGSRLSRSKQPQRKNSSTPGTPLTPMTPPIGYYAPPKVNHAPHPPHPNQVNQMYAHPYPPMMHHQPIPLENGPSPMRPGSSATEPIDLS